MKERTRQAIDRQQEIEYYKGLAEHFKSFGKRHKSKPNLKIAEQCKQEAERINKEKVKI
jgi:hypothetical protein